MSSIKLSESSFEEFKNQIEKKNYYTDVKVSENEVKILTEGGWIVIENNEVIK